MLPNTKQISEILNQPEIQACIHLWDLLRLRASCVKLATAAATPSQEMPLPVPGQERSLSAQKRLDKNIRQQGIIECIGDKSNCQARLEQVWTLAGPQTCS